MADKQYKPFACFQQMDTIEVCTYVFQLFKHISNIQIPWRLSEVNLSLADIVHIVFMQTEAIFAVCVALRNR